MVRNVLFIAVCVLYFSCVNLSGCVSQEIVGPLTPPSATTKEPEFSHTFTMGGSLFADGRKGMYIPPGEENAEVDDVRIENGEVIKNLKGVESRFSPARKFFIWGNEGIILLYEPTGWAAEGIGEFIDGNFGFTHGDDSLPRPASLEEVMGRPKGWRYLIILVNTLNPDVAYMVSETLDADAPVRSAYAYRFSRMMVERKKELIKNPPPPHESWLIAPPNSKELLERNPGIETFQKKTEVVVIFYDKKGGAEILARFIKRIINGVPYYGDIKDHPSRIIILLTDLRDGEVDFWVSSDRWGSICGKFSISSDADVERQKASIIEVLRVALPLRRWEIE